MAARSATYNINDVLSHAWFNFSKSPEFADNFLDGWALFKRLKSMKAIDEVKNHVPYLAVIASSGYAMPIGMAGSSFWR